MGVFRKSRRIYPLIDRPLASWLLGSPQIEERPPFWRGCAKHTLLMALWLCVLILGNLNVRKIGRLGGYHRLNNSRTGNVENIEDNIYNGGHNGGSENIESLKQSKTCGLYGLFKVGGSMFRREGSIIILLTRFYTARTFIMQKKMQYHCRARYIENVFEIKPFNSLFRNTEIH